MRTMRFVCWLALPAGLLIGGINAASAQSEEVRQACTPDAMRLCSEFIPDAEKVKTCMIRKRGELSEACRTAIAGGRRIRRVYHYERRRIVHHHYHHHYRHYRRRK
jgi:hypothetical protein